MASLEDVVIPVSIEGGDAVKSTLEDIANTGAVSFAKLAESVSTGDFTALAELVGGRLAASFNQAAESIAEFIHSEAEAVEMQSNLSSAIGASLSQFNGLQEVFGSVGVSVQGFDRSMGRLAQSVANSWSQIQQQVRGDSQATANATLGVQEANLNLEKSYNALRQAAADAAASQAHDANNLQSSLIALAKAQDAAYNRGLGGGGSGFTKDEIKDMETLLSLKKAEQAVEDARRKQMEDQANAMTAMEEKEMAVAKAANARAEAEQKAYEVSLKSLPDIANHIREVINGTISWDQGLKTAEVSANNLAHALVLASSKMGERPAGIDVLKEMAEYFSKIDNTAEGAAQKMEIVQRLMGAGFRAGQASAAQVIAALQEIADRGGNVGKTFEDLKHKFEDLTPSKSQAEDLHHLEGAWADLAQQIALVQEKLAAMAAPVLTAVLHGISEAITYTIEKFKEFKKYIDDTFGAGTTDKIVGWSAIVLGIAAAVVAVVAALGGIVIVVGVIGAGFVALGALVPSAFVSMIAIAVAFGAIIATQIPAAWQAVSSAVSNFASGFSAYIDSWKQWVTDLANHIMQSLSNAWNFVKSLFSGAGVQGGSGGASNAAPGGAADGGLIRGPGSGTSDTAGLWALSDGEYVVKADAVKNYGVDFFNAVNSMALGAMAMGGPVGAIRTGSTGPGETSRPFNLVIDGNHFSGLKAPEAVAARLKTYAVGRQSASAGIEPSWRR